VTRYAPVEPLTPEHDRSTFDCGSASQTQWLRQHALPQQADTCGSTSYADTASVAAGYYGLRRAVTHPRRRRD
jgi:hypothetical protein